MNIRRIITAATLLATLTPALALAAPAALESGSFVTAAHETAGTATIYKLDNGSRLLRLTEFHTSNGPAVHVILGDPKSGKHIDLGDLKGNIGNQNYAIPQNVSLNDYHSVAIYCARFHVVFGSAQLK